MAEGVAYRPTSAGAHVASMQEYGEVYGQSLRDAEAFWGMVAEEQLSFFQPYTHVQQGSLKDGNVAWFLNGKLNVCYNAVDRHLVEHGDQVAILWEGDEPGTNRRITYSELHVMVCQFANMLHTLGVQQGDTVCIYMPMVPEAAVAMLACARLGAPHSVVFAGFSADALRDRIIDADSRIVITADEGCRGGKRIRLKDIVDEALRACPRVRHCVVYKRTGAKIRWKEGRDVWMQEAMQQERAYCPAASIDSEHPLFLLYTSGSTGRPKGILHTSAGYALWASYTHKLVFDYSPGSGDVYACVADVGWITGHSYIVYGPLINCATTLMFESTPLYPDASRYWDLVQRHNIKMLYTAPTAIRALMRHGDEPVKKHDVSSLRVLGSVGEPINPEAWSWYFKVVGHSNTPIVDTYWQTETGGIMVSPLPGATPLKPGSATFPLPGVELALLDPKSGELVEGNEKEGVLCVRRPWPGMARSIYGDHQRYRTVYLDAYKGYYFTGDGAMRDKDGYYWVTGRVDDVLNVSGHRIGSAEVESALVAHASVSEAAVVGIPHNVKGTSLFAYVIPTAGVAEAEWESLASELKAEVKHRIGSFAKPDKVLITNGLPKTRSGKIMRRLLRKIASKEHDNLGDISTLADPSVVDHLIQQVK